MNTRTLRDFFASTHSLARLTSQNGWPDPDSLRVEVVGREGDTLTCSVTFEEVVVEGAGCIADRVSCWGRYRLRLNGEGQVVDARLEAGARDDDPP